MSWLKPKRQVRLESLDGLPDSSGCDNRRKGAFSECARGWIFSVAPFLEHVDSIRICPSDLLREERSLEMETSYALNSYLGLPIPGAKRNIHKLPASSKTIMLMEATDHLHGDHVEAHEWFDEATHHLHGEEGSNIFEIVRHDLAVDRHGSSANYLYADGHVAAIPAAQIAEWVNEPVFNFAKPPIADARHAAENVHR